MLTTSTAKATTSTANAECSYKRTTPFDKRCSVSQTIRDQYPRRIPVILERAPTANKRTTPTVTQQKFLVPDEFTVGQFLAQVRRIATPTLAKEHAIFLFVGTGVLPPAVALMSQIYDRFRDEDGFLYVRYSGENTFGFFEAVLSTLFNLLS